MHTFDNQTSISDCLLPKKTSSEIRKVFKEKSIHVPEYAITCNGEPICLSEYATDITQSTLSTVVMLNEDYSSYMGKLLTKDHINLESGLDEKILKSREGRDRLTYGFNVKNLKVHQYFKDSREVHDRHVFQFPHHLREAGADIFNFEGVSQGYKEYVIDLRTP